jgi:hypothetical protein
MRKVAERRPLVVTLVGSSRFKAHHELAQREETLRGKIVLPMGTYGHLERLDMDGTIKQMLDELHLRKIDESDEVLVVNPEGGFIGQSTTREIIYAAMRGKILYCLSRPIVKPDVPDYLAQMFAAETRHIPWERQRPTWVTT